ncbi:hypothetical protein TRFO_37803 [Tritrichomonas foetus]|uniref:Protein kinase domain-containing protein n=1 Tax=Tritrichomonas foetus TaxID=1144522 RepID=A0A1J4JA62_9EUKA|nr:hypothetical protein TRFO_37803 [Tritrichomonas foetus]|eukprot:OHS96074.1 hypothetical protein TRFO_37803 [Tritrichomonas foetus]
MINDEIDQDVLKELEKISEYEVDIKNYEIGKYIGQGGFGQVFHCTEIKSGKMFVMKISKESLIFMKKNIKNLIREIATMGLVDHPTIVKFIGYSPNIIPPEELQTHPYRSHNNHPIIILEILERDLHKAIYNNEELSPTFQLKTIVGMAVAMMYLHSNNILHRDFKPSNVLLDSNGCVKVCDFGFSKLVEDDNIMNSITISQAPIYTPSFAPPELKNNKYGIKSDMFSFAITCWCLLTQKKPYAFGGFVCFKVWHENLRPNEKLIENENLRDLIVQCWDDDPNKRPDFETFVQIILRKEFWPAGVNEHEIFEYLNEIGMKSDGHPKVPFVKVISKDHDEFDSIDKIDIIEEIDVELDEPTASIGLYQKAIEFYWKKDFKKAFTKFKESAKKGNTSAKYYMGIMYIYGEGVEKNIVEGEKLIKYAADMGNNLALKTYLEILKAKEIVPKEENEIIDYYMTSAERGNSNAMKTLYFIYADRYDVEKIVPFLKHLSATGFNPASLWLAKYYQRLCDMNNDQNAFNTSLTFYKIACDQDNGEACLYLGKAFYTPYKGFTVNLLTAMNYLKMASNFGNAEAKYYLGKILYSHVSASNNEENSLWKYMHALNYFEESYKLGYSEAAFEYAAMYFNGEGCLKSIGMATKIYRNASENGDSHFSEIIAEKFLFGEDAPQDYNEAKIHFWKAAQKGLKEEKQPDIKKSEPNHGLKICQRIVQHFEDMDDLHEATKYHQFIYKHWNDQKSKNYVFSHPKFVKFETNDEYYQFFDECIDKNVPNAIDCYVSFMKTKDKFPKERKTPQEKLELYRSWITRGFHDPVYKYLWELQKEYCNSISLTKQEREICRGKGFT